MYSDYLIVDLIGDYNKIGGYEDVKDLLIEEIVNDLRTNMNDSTLEESMKNNLEVLEKLAREKETPIKYIKEQLKSYSFKVIDLLELQSDLLDIKHYFESKDCLEYTGKTDEVVNIINKELCKNGR